MEGGVHEGVLEVRERIRVSLSNGQFLFLRELTHWRLCRMEEPSWS